MPGFWQVSTGASLLSLVSAIEAFAGGPGCWPPIYPIYSWPVPTYVYPGGVRVIPLVNSCETVPPPPMPPQSKEPPLQKQPQGLKPPRIDSTRSLSGADNKEQCSVGFWNLTGRDVTLTIDGKSVMMAKNRKITVELNRQFDWQADNGMQRMERVPVGQTTFEVVVRE